MPSGLLSGGAHEHAAGLALQPAIEFEIRHVVCEVPRQKPGVAHQLVLGHRGRAEQRENAGLRRLARPG